MKCPLNYCDGELVFNERTNVHMEDGEDYQPAHTCTVCDSIFMPNGDVIMKFDVSDRNYNPVSKWTKEHYKKEKELSL